MDDGSSPQHEERSQAGFRALFAATAIALGALALVVGMAVWAPWRQAAGLATARVNEQSLSAARDARRAALRQVWRSLSEYKAEHGAWPANLDELRAFAPIIDDVLAPPPLSERGEFEIDFEALSAPSDGGPAWVVVDDPGYRAPGAAGDDSALEPFRVVLLGTGEALSLEEARRRGARHRLAP